MLAPVSPRSHRIACHASTAICSLRSGTASWHLCTSRHTSSTRALSIWKYPLWKPLRISKRSEKWRGALQEVDTQSDAPLSAISELRAAVVDGDIHEIIRLYNACSDKKSLTGLDFHSLAQRLQAHATQFKRLPAAQSKREDGEELAAFAHHLVTDLRKALLWPNPRAHTRLLVALKELGDWDAGVQFWDWLQAQDDAYVQPRTYGAAIELLAVRGSPLPRLEELYQQALARFPCSFSAYHLSPHAILPDRERAFEVKGMPMALLQGILAARLMGGDSRNAYLALDTALRLYPTNLGHRFLRAFLGDRPVSESYSVFALAYRAGILLPVNIFKAMLSTLRTSSDLTDVTRHFLVLRSMLSISYMCAGAGSAVTTNTVSELLIATTQILRLRGVEKLELEQKRQIASALLEIIRKTLEIFSRYGTKPGVAAFNSIITNVAGLGHLEGTIATTLADMKLLGLQPNNVTRRSIITAAGELRDGDLIWSTWATFLSAKAADDLLPDATDFHILFKACVLAGECNSARKELEIRGKHLSEQELENLLSRLEKGEEETDGNAQPVDVDIMLEEIQKVSSDLDIIDRHTAERPVVQDFSEQALPMTIIPMTNNLSLPEAEMRTVYDELTTEQTPLRSADNSLEASGTEASDDTAPAASLSEGPDPDLSLNIKPTTYRLSLEARSSTNVFFADLRYESWKVVNHLLAQADQHDKAYHKAVDEAIAQGVAPPKRNLGMFLDSDSDLRSYGLSDAVRIATNATTRADAVHLQNVREQILRLRGLLPDVSHDDGVN